MKTNWKAPTMIVSIVYCTSGRLEDADGVKYNCVYSGRLLE